MQTNNFVAVEANIGVGKSTLLPRLISALNEFKHESEPEWCQIQEPVDDPVFAELLQQFYDNPENPDVRIEFQMYLTNRRSDLVKGLDRNKHYVIERSLFSDLVFSQANFLSMEQPSAAYMDYYYDIKRRLVEYPHVDLCVYLQADPRVAYERMLQRGRDSEMDIPLEYMEDIHRFHEACLPQICREYKSTIKTYDWNLYGDPMRVASDILKHFEKPF